MVDRISLWNCFSSKPDKEGKPIMVDGRRDLINLNIDPHPVVKLTLQPYPWSQQSYASTNVPFFFNNCSGSVSLHELNTIIRILNVPSLCLGIEILQITTRLIMTMKCSCLSSVPTLARRN